MADEPRSIQARIAALNLGQVNRGPSEAHAIVLGRPGLENRRQTVQNPPTSEPQPPSANGIGNEPNGTGSNGVLPPPVITRTGQNSPQESKTAGPPKMPPRRPSRSPALPPRRPSEQLSRRDSSESISSTLSSVSAVSIGPARTSTCRAPSMDGGRIRAPIYDPSTLPPLPPKRSPQEKEKEKARIPLKMTKSTLNVLPTQVLPPPSMPALPPRPAAKQLNGNTRKLPPEAPPPTPKRPGPSLNLNGSQIPRDTNEMAHGTTNGTSPSTGNASIGPTPPLVPLASRPDLSKVLATKPVAQASSSPASCLKCRDFSAPDGHAATFPRHAVPSLDWLASQLTTPFPSSTDKARAIFTWLHHNISYDVDAFFNNRVKPATPSSTLSSGLAVCEGYAGLFTALANKAGLESMVIGGHGKGFGFASLPPGVPIPAEHSNHAWNAVKIDAGEWKLIDCCWGAGNISGKGQPYNKDFTPKFFTMDNNEFGLRHFPTNRNHFFRTDGRFRLSWEEYIAGEQGGETVRTFNLVAQEGMDETKVLPKYLTIPIDASKHRAPTVRFQLEKVCAHWDPVRNGRGKPYVYVLQIHGRDGREKDFVPLDTNGMYWWVDVPPGMLGATGQTVTLYTVESVGGRDGRGLSVGDYREAKGRKAMGFGGVCAWELG